MAENLTSSPNSGNTLVVGSHYLSQYRAKDFKGKWQYGTYYYGCMYPTSWSAHYVNDENIDEKTLGQFTGLSDKNDIEIYGGEIIFNDDRKEYGVVKWDSKKAMFVTEYLVSKDCFPIWETLSNLYYSVGNVFDNPELLEGV